jgi:hypothetical protein
VASDRRSAASFLVLFDSYTSRWLLILTIDYWQLLIKLLFIFYLSAFRYTNIGRVYREVFMNYKIKMLIPVVGMIVVLSYAAIKVVSSEADEIEQRLPPSITNLAQANTVEIKDGSGQVVLSGNFSASNSKPDEVERKAVLAGTGAGASATGKAEIEISKMKNGATEQEIEIEVSRLTAATAFSLFVDGQEVGTFTTDAKGEAEIEFSSNSPSK